MMRKESDSIDRALKSLRSAQWTTGPHQQDLENELMEQFHTSRAVSGGRSYRSFIVTVAALLIGGAGFAAARGPEMVKKWFVKVRLVGPNGETFNGVLEPVSEDDATAELHFQADDGTETKISVRKLQPGDADADGAATMVQLELDKPGEEGSSADARILVPEGETGSIIVGSVPGEPDIAFGNIDAGQFVELALTVDGHGTAEGEMVDLTVDMAGADPLRQKTRALGGISAALAERDPIEWWYDEEGYLRELFLLPFGEEGGEQTGFNVLLRRSGDEEISSVGVVGTLGGVDPATTELVDIEWTLAGEATLQFETADGEFLTLTVAPEAHDRIDRMRDEMNRVRLQRVPPDDR